MLIAIACLALLPLALLAVFYLWNIRRVVEELSSPSFGSALGIGALPVILLAGSIQPAILWALIHILLCALVPDTPSLKSLWVSLILGALSGAIVFSILNFVPNAETVRIIVGDPLRAIGYGTVGGLIYRLLMTNKIHSQ